MPFALRYSTAEINEEVKVEKDFTSLFGRAMKISLLPISIPAACSLIIVSLDLDRSPHG